MRSQIVGSMKPAGRLDDDVDPEHVPGDFGGMIRWHEAGAHVPAFEVVAVEHHAHVVVGPGQQMVQDFRAPDVRYGDHVETLVLQGEPVNLPTDPAEPHHAHAQLSHQATSSIFSVLVPPCTLR